MTLADDLRAARALIDSPEKWLKNELRRDGCFCAMGAGLEVKNGAVLLAIQGQLPDPYSTIPAYNDLPTTTHADIMALFDRAITDAETSHAE